MAVCAYMSECLLCAVPWRSEVLDPWNWSYRQLLSQQMWILGTELRSCGRTADAHGRTQLFFLTWVLGI